MNAITVGMEGGTQAAASVLKRFSKVVAHDRRTIYLRLLDDVAICPVVGVSQGQKVVQPIWPQLALLLCVQEPINHRNYLHGRLLLRYLLPSARSPARMHVTDFNKFHA